MGFHIIGNLKRGSKSRRQRENERLLCVPSMQDLRAGVKSSAVQQLISGTPVRYDKG